MLRPTQWCFPQMEGEKYRNIADFKDAMRMCNEEEDCMMFYDVNSEKEKYILCDRKSDIHLSSNSSSLFLKCKCFERIENLITT